MNIVAHCLILRRYIFFSNKIRESLGSHVKGTVMKRVLKGNLGNWGITLLNFACNTGNHLVFLKILILSKHTMYGWLKMEGGSVEEKGVNPSDAKTQPIQDCSS